MREPSASEIRGLWVSSSLLSSRMNIQNVIAISTGMKSITNKVVFGLKPMVVSKA